MSGELPTISRGDLWTIESTDYDWSQFRIEGGSHAGRCDNTGPSYSQPRQGSPLNVAARMLAGSELAYDQTNFLDYSVAHQGFDDIERVIEGSRLFVDPAIMRTTKARVLGALASRLESEYDLVSSAIGLNPDKLVVAYIDKANVTPRLATARVHEVRDVADRRQFGNLKLIIKGKSGEPAVASPTMKRLPGLYMSLDLLK